MKYKFTLLYILLLFVFAAGAQNITGIWRGYFAQNSFGMYEDKYKFEIQIEQSKNYAISGVTYSYKTTVFYGKATLQGVYTKATKNVVINEIKLVELKIGNESQPCLMTCYLEYDKMGNLETLTGTYTSRNVRDKGDCGSGKVYLEKTTTTDFYKEDFLLKKNNNKKKTDDVAKLMRPKPNTQSLNNRPKYTPPPSTTKNNVAKVIPKVKPGAEGNLIQKKAENPTSKPPVVVPIVPREHKEDVAKIKPMDKPLPKPEVLRKRNNELVKTFYTTVKEIKIELYDNGEIDGDTISVYHNNRLVVSRKKLTDKPITITVHADEDDSVHEFVMVAENLGSIPPNTALMVITAGNKRYETFVTSTEQKNAVVVLEYRAGTP